MKQFADAPSQNGLWVHPQRTTVMSAYRSRKRILIKLTGACVALALIGVIILTTLYVVATNVRDMHSVVLDAGSSSTKLNLYRWRDKPFRTNGEVQVVANDKVVPGISDYIDRPFDAYRDIAPVLKKLTKRIIRQNISKVPIYLAATAGMRLKLLVDPLGSIELFDVLRRSIQKSGLQVEALNERVRMLSGAEEGLYGWVSTNYMLGLVNENAQADPLRTVGSLDLGGASTQISFVPEEKPATDATSVDYYPLGLFGKTYEVYSRSFLCYGKNEFEKRVMSAVIGSQTSSEIGHPCFLKGHVSKQTDADSIFSTSCVSGGYAKRAFGRKLTKPSTHDKFLFRGTGNVTECDRVIRAQFHNADCRFTPCSLDHVHRPPVRGQFRAYSGFSFVIDYLFKDRVTGFTRQEIRQEVEKFCNMDWTQISANKKKFADKYCFDGLYILALLENFGFMKDEDFRLITFSKQINGNTISWALGYMLDQSGKLPSESPKVNIPTAVFVGSTILLLFLLLSAIAGLVLACHQ